VFSLQRVTSRCSWTSENSSIGKQFRRNTQQSTLDRFEY